MKNSNYTAISTKVGTSSLQSGKTLTSLMGNTAIPSSLGTTVTGALTTLSTRGVGEVEWIASGSTAPVSGTYSCDASKYSFIVILIEDKSVAAYDIADTFILPASWIQSTGSFRVRHYTTGSTAIVITCTYSISNKTLAVASNNVNWAPLIYAIT